MLDKMTWDLTMKTALHSFWREWRVALVFLSLMGVFRSAVADYMYVPSGSMNPTLMDGDRIIVDKRVYGFRVPFTLVRLTDGQAPKRGDIAVFQSPADGKTLVKRVVGLPGDTVAMEQDRLMINGQPAAYTPVDFAAEADLVAEFSRQPHSIVNESVAGVDHWMMKLPQRPAMRSFEAVTIPEGAYWMMGDNRDDSADSRYIGAVPRELIFGRATAVLASPNPDHNWLPRADRWFLALH